MRGAAVASVCAVTADETPTSRPRTNTRRTLVEQEIYESATRLFAERGFAGTSFQDIADAVGLTRPALYHYVRSKDELLARLVSEITESAAAEIAAVAERDDLPPAERVHGIAAAIARRQGSHAARFQLLVRSEADLPEEIAAAHAAGRRAVLRLLAGVVAEGVADGSFRDVDPRVAALGIIGMSNWVAWWFQPGGRDDLDAVCEELAGIAVGGLRGDPARPVATTPAEAVGVLRADLARLERLLEG